MSGYFDKTGTCLDNGNLRDGGSWIGVDLDGTLAHYIHGADPEEIGSPIGPMLYRVQQWLAEGRTVKIFTARAAIPKQVRVIKAWLVENGLPSLEVTNIKDFGMVELWDDRCIPVRTNIGLPAVEITDRQTYRRSTRSAVSQKSKMRSRSHARPIAKLLFTIKRVASSWSQVSDREFIPISSRRS